MADVRTQKEEDDTQAVRQVFDQIAFRYDFLNDLFSGFIHHHWMRVLVREEPCSVETKVLDVCTGTADVAIAIARHNSKARIVGLDISEKMLSLAKAKIARLKLEDRIELCWGDGLAMPLADQSVDVVFNSFGLRNQGDYKKALTEMARVLKFQGRINILEFTRPANIVIRSVYLFYLTRIMPVVSRFFLKERASFDYLSRTIKHFPAPDVVAQLMRDCGFAQVCVKPLTGGIACLYRATRVPADGGQGPRGAQGKSCYHEDRSR